MLCYGIVTWWASHTHLTAACDYIVLLSRTKATGKCSGAFVSDSLSKRKGWRDSRKSRSKEWETSVPLHLGRLIGTSCSPEMETQGFANVELLEPQSMLVKASSPRQEDFCALLWSVQWYYILFVLVLHCISLTFCWINHRPAWLSNLKKGYLFVFLLTCHVHITQYW